MWDHWFTVGLAIISILVFALLFYQVNLEPLTWTEFLSNKLSLKGKDLTKQPENNHSKYWEDTFEISIENQVKTKPMGDKKHILKWLLFLFFIIFLSFLKFPYNFLLLTKITLLFN